MNTYVVNRYNVPTEGATSQLITFDSNTVRQFTAHQKNTKVILFVGSGYKRKGLEEFIRIIAALKNQEVIAIVVGKEKNTTYYKIYIERDIPNS